MFNVWTWKKNGKVLTSKFVGTGPSSFEKRIYQAAVLQMLRNTGLDSFRLTYASLNLGTTCGGQFARML